MTRVEELLQKVGESVEECAEALHDALLKSRPSDAQDYAMALSSAAGAYRELAETYDNEAEEAE